MAAAELAPVVTLSATLPVPPARAWRALVDGAERTRWWPQLERLDARRGGRFEERWHDGGRDVTTAGTVEACTPGHRLELLWADDDWPASTRVTLEFSEAPGGVAIHLRHEGWEALEGGAELASAHERGWRGHLRALAHHLGTEVEVR